MGQIKLDGITGCSSTMVSNYFIDEFMPEANGEFVKVFLYLLRVLSENGSIIECSIADKLNQTDSDVTRALNYWENKGLLVLERNSDNEITRISLIPCKDTVRQIVNVSDLQQDSTTKSSYVFEDAGEPKESARIEKPSNPALDLSPKNYTSDDYDDVLKNVDFQTEIIYPIEKMYGATLPRHYFDSLVFMYNELHLEPELIVWVAEYSLELKKRSIKFWEKIAIEWHENGIKTVKDAKQYCTGSNNCDMDSLKIMRAFGVYNKPTADNEVEFIDKWLKTLKFDVDVIVKACKIGMNEARNKSGAIRYANGVLEKWRQGNVHTLEEAEAFDNEFYKHSKQNYSSAKNTHLQVDPNNFKPTKNTNKASENGLNSKATAGKNTFFNFEQRDYDYEEHQKRLINKAIKK